MKSKIFSCGISIIILVLCVSACREAGVWLVKEDVQVYADAIVLLMGSVVDRVLEASDEFKQGNAGKLIIVEESMGAYQELESRGVNIISNTKQVRNSLLALGVPVDSIIILPGNATSTQMEAMIIRDYLANKSGIDTLLLISSAPHTRRASMIFKFVFRKAKMPVCVICSPSKYTNFDTERWWRSKEGIQMVLLEYIKMGSFLVLEKRKLKRRA